MKFIILVDDRKVEFVKKGKKRVDIGGGSAMVNIDLVLADGSKYDGIGIFDEQSSGEHCGTYIMLDDALVGQSDDDFLEKLGKTAKEVYPFKYKKRAELFCLDIHVDEETGWSG